MKTKLVNIALAAALLHIALAVENQYGSTNGLAETASFEKPATT